MGFLVPEQQLYERPDDGLHPAKVKDVVDKGLVKTTWQGKERETWKGEITLVVLDQLDSKFQPLEVRHRFTVSSHPKSSLTKMLTGLGFTPNPGFDLMSLVGVECQILLKTVKTEDGREFSNVEAFVPKARPVTAAPAPVAAPAPAADAPVVDRAQAVVDAVRAQQAAPTTNPDVPF